jgi:hypothetical protein
MIDISVYINYSIRSLEFQRNLCERRITYAKIKYSRAIFSVDKTLILEEGVDYL